MEGEILLQPEGSGVQLTTRNLFFSADYIIKGFCFENQDHHMILCFLSKLAGRKAIKKLLEHGVINESFAIKFEEYIKNSNISESENVYDDIPFYWDKKNLVPEQRSESVH